MSAISVSIAEWQAMIATGAVVPDTSYTISDTAENIEGLSASQIDQAADLGVTIIAATDASLALSAAEAVAVENAAPPAGGTIQVVAPVNDTVVVSDSAADLQALTVNEIGGLQPIGVGAIAVNDVVRPDFSSSQLAALGQAGLVINQPTGVSLTAAALIGSEANAAALAPGTAYTVADTPSDIEALTPAAIAAAASQVTSIASSGSLVLSVAQALALENASLPVSVPAGDSAMLVDTAATLETLTATQLSALGAIGITAVAGSDAPPVFSSAQMQALGAAAIPVVAPPNDPTQNDDPVTISAPGGTGLTFVVTFDSSVASAPDGFVAAVEQAFQFYADTFSNPLILYYDVGWGETNGKSSQFMGPDAAGASSQWGSAPVSESYAQLYAQLSADQSSPVQKLAVASLPPTDPTGGMSLLIAPTEGEALGVPNLPAVTDSNPNGYIGFNANPTLPWNFSTGPNFYYPPSDQDAELMLFAFAAHEISEDMGRVSELEGTEGADVGTGQYSPIDLFRFSEPDPDGFNPNGRALSPSADPSYFSIDDGTTPLAYWNNYTAGDTGDLADWKSNTPMPPPPNDPNNGPDAYDNHSGATKDSPISATDVSLMNVLGWDLRNPTNTVQLPSSDIVITAADYLNDVTLDTIDPGSADPPTGDNYVIADTALDIESLFSAADVQTTQVEITDLNTLGVVEIISTDGLVDLADQQVDPPMTNVTPVPVTALLTVAQTVALESEGQNRPAGVPSIETATIFDTAANIATMLTPQVIDLLPIYVTQIESSDASITLDVSQVQALEGPISLTGGPQTPIVGPIEAPAGDAVILADSAANIADLSPQQITALPLLGIDAIQSQTSPLTLTLDQLDALENIDFSGPGLSLSGATIVVTDVTADEIKALSRQQILAFGLLGVSSIESADTSVTIDADQAEALEGPYADGPIQIALTTGGTVTLVDVGTSIAGMSAAQLSELPSIGVTGIEAFVLTAFVINIAQAVAIEDAGLTLSVSGGGLQIADTAGDIEALSTNPAQLAALSQLANYFGPLSLTATDAPIVLTLDQAIAFVGTSLSLVDPLGVIVTVTPLQSKSLAATTIDQLAALGVNEIETSFGSGQFSVADIAALEANGITVQTTPLVGPQIISDTAANIASMLTPQVIDALPNLSPDVIVIESTTGLMTFDVPQIQALVAEPNTAVGAAGFAVADTAAEIAKLTPDQLNAMAATDQIFPVGITVTQGSELDLSAQQATALSYAGPFGVSFRLTGPSGMAVVIDDSAADIKALTPTQLADLQNIDVSAINADASLSLTVAQAEAYGEEAVGYITVPTNDTVTIADDADKITAFLDQGATDVELVSQFDSLDGITSSGPIALTVSEAETLETANATLGKSVAITAASGAVTLTDTAANIEQMSPAQLEALSSIGVAAVDVTDQSIMLTVAQALALYDPIPITVPIGDSVYVADSESNIAALTPAQIKGLASIGVDVFEVNSPLSGGDLMIDGRLTLSPGGAVPANETITFAGTGGTLALSQDAPGTDVAGTIYGFSPPDTIDLTDVPYDPINGSAELSTDPNNGNQAIEVDENGNSYYLDIDPSQYFLTPASFALNPDRASTGTDLTVTEPPVSGFGYSVPEGATADGVVIQSGDVEVIYGGTANRTIIEGGTLTADDGSTVDDTFIGSGGILDLSYANSATGTITFEAASGGTLKIDNPDAYPLSAIIDGFAIGDVIDLVNVFGPSPSVVLGTGNQLQVTIDGNVYALNFDPTQNFSGEHFAATPDGNGGTDIVLSLADAWVGPSAKNHSGDWNTAGNWKTGAVPNAFVPATIGGTKAYTVTSNQSNTVGSLVLSDAAATLDIAAGTFAVAGLGADTNAGKITVGDGAALQLTGIFTNTGTGTIALKGTGDATSLIVAGHALLKGGQVALGDAAGNAIVSNGAAATLTNQSMIAGSGTIGDADLTLINAATGVIDATGTAEGLTISSAHTFKNQGTVESTGSAGLTIEGALLNTGTLAASAGDLTVTGNVTGTGSDTIGDNATLTLDAHVAATQTVTFTGSPGTLALALGQGFTGTVAGFATGDAIDLENFAYSTSTKKLSITAVTTKGSDTVVTIKDGGLTATIALFNQTAGEFGTSASDYTLSSDLHGTKPGTLLELAAAPV